MEDGILEGGLAKILSTTKRLVCEHGDTVIEDGVEKRLVFIGFLGSEVLVDEADSFAEVRWGSWVATSELGLPCEVDIGLDLEFG